LKRRSHTGREETDIWEGIRLSTEPPKR
jgi:hypothetical protein